MKTLIAYFTWSGTTQKIAGEIARITNGDLFLIERTVPYSREYNTVAYEEAKAEIEHKRRPEIKGPLPDISRYDNIIVAFPIWWYTMPLPVWTFLESYSDWKGKTIHLFANSYTNDPKYMKNSLADAISCVKNGIVEPGLFNNEFKEVVTWVKEHLK